MKISAINNYNILNTCDSDTVSLKSGYNRKVQFCDNEKQKVYASNLGFRGQIPLTNLINDYNWFINYDKVPAINAFLKIEAPKESMEQLLRFILSKEDQAYEFIDSIVKQPRNIQTFSKGFDKKLPYDSVIFNIYSGNNPYIKAFEKYMDRRYQNASSVSELLTIRPDWKEEVLLSKHRELYHNDNFELGEIPESIGKENFDKITDYLKQYSGFGFKTDIEIPDLDINGRIFKFKQYIDGKSDKHVFRIETPNGERFVIKTADPARNGLNLAAGLGTVSLVDTYLTKNRCRNAAPIRYYNKNNNIAICDYITHNKVPQIRYSIVNLSDKMPDIRDLGITINDTIGSNNYFKLDSSQNALKSAYDFAYGVINDEVVSVDNDHATYGKILLPTVNKYFQYLPNEMQMFF